MFEITDAINDQSIKGMRVILVSQANYNNRNNYKGWRQSVRSNYRKEECR